METLIEKSSSYHHGFESIDWKGRAIRAEKRLEDMELLALYANDIVRFWPSFTLRTIPTMTKAIETLKQAIEKVQP